MDEKKRQKHLQIMEIQTWEVRKSEQIKGADMATHKRKKAVEEEVKQPAKATSKKAVTLNQEKPIAELTWKELEEQVANCTRCDLYKTRTQTVFGVGNRQADLLIIGEAPGSNEDKQGEPFVGRAGKLLNSMLHAINLSREEIFIANILKSRPPNNRDPKPEEVAACTPFLLRQITLLKPKLILAVGRIAAQFLLNTTEAMGKLRGQEFTYGPYHTPLLVTYHPAYLLRAPREKRKSWDDLQLVVKRLEQLSHK